MPNKFVIFPESKLASAELYKAWADAQWQALCGIPGEQVGLLSTDAFGQHVTTYYGPPFTYFEEVPEPADGPLMRSDGVLHDNWVRPPSEEEPPVEG